MSFRSLVVIVVLVFVGFLCLVLVFYQIISKSDEVTEIKVRELILIFLTLLVTGVVSSFVVHKQKILVYLGYTFYRILYHIFQNVVGSGFFAAFMTTAKLGYLYYLFVVPRFVFDNFEDSFFLEHHQKRIGATASFLIGQLVIFTSVYHPRLHEILMQPYCIFLIFLVFFVTQVLWVRLTIVRNWKFRYPNDKRKKVVRRIILLQVEFMSNFFLQLAFLPSNSYIEPSSQVRILVNMYLFNMVRKKKPVPFVFIANRVVGDQEKKIFLQTSFVGWLIGHIFFLIFYIKLFKLIVIITIWVRNWLRKNFFEK